jgi:hypothetical protein
VKSPDDVPADHEYAGDNDVAENVAPPDDDVDVAATTVGTLAAEEPPTNTSADKTPPTFVDPRSVCT